MDDTDFNSHSNLLEVKPNPSNQNFYSKLVFSLGEFNNVSVLSLRPLAKGSLKNLAIDESVNLRNNIHYYYPRSSSSKCYKLFKEKKNILSIFDRIVENEKYDSFVIIVDTLRRQLLECAHLIAKKYKAKLIGMVTDNPLNLTGVRKGYAKGMIKKAHALDAYLSLSESLNEIYNPNGKPHYAFSGLVEDPKTSFKPQVDDYFFFGGALYDRYGVKTLIDSFHNSTNKHKLVIAGHGPLASYARRISRIDERIVFVDRLKKEEMYGYEKNAIANINPRPFDKTLDNESVPSKLLEYFASGKPTVSTIHSKLYKEFENSATWLKETTLLDFFNSFDSMNYNDLLSKAKDAHKKVFELYSLDVQGKAITDFIEKL